jgi:hypothetical protein
MGAVQEAVSDFTGSVSDAVSSVGETIQDTGQAVVDSVVEPVVKAVQNTYDAFEKDPVGTTLKLAAAASGDPTLIMATNTAVNVAQGQDINDAVENAARTTAETLIVKEAGKYAMDEFGTPTSEPIVDIEAGPTPTIETTAPAPSAPVTNTIIKSGAEGATKAALQGKDPIEGATSNIVSSGVSSGINAGTSAVSKEVSDADFEKWSQEQAEKSYENAPSPTEQDVLSDPSVPINFPLSTPTTETGPGYYNEATGEFVSDPSGGLQAPLDNTSGTNLDSMKDYTYDTATNTWTAPDGEVISLNDLSNTQTPLDTGSVLPPPSVAGPEAYNPLNVKPALDYAAKAALQKAAADKAAAARAAAARAAATKAAQTGNTTESNNLLGLLALLDTKAPQTPVQNNPNDIKYFYDIMGSDILPPTVPKTEKPVFNYAEGGTIEDLIRMLRS